MGSTLHRGTWRHLAIFGGIQPVFLRFRENVLPNGDLGKRENFPRKSAREFNLSLSARKWADFSFGDKNCTVCFGSSSKVAVSPNAAMYRRVRALGVRISFPQFKSKEKALDSSQNRGLV